MIALVRLRYLVDFYLATIKVAIINQFQYRVSHYFYTLGMVAEPVIYLVVWSTIANTQGGAVSGYTAGSFAAYYIAWTLVRSMNIVFTPYGWEGRIQRGQLSAMLLRPLHPLHYDLAWFGGGKIAWIIMWLPIAAGLTLVFHPVFTPTAPGIITFAFAIWGAYLIRSLALWLLGMITFWTTRTAALFELYMALELVLSGRLVPMALMPPWVQQVANFLPFQWTFNFPITALIGNLSTAQLVSGLGMQALWIAIYGLILAVVWRAGIRQYSAVGN